MKKIARIVLSLVGGILLVILAGVLFVSVRSSQRMNRAIDVELAELTIPEDPAAVERGRHRVAGILACNACHGRDLAGDAFFDAAPMGTLAAANLTAGAGGIGGEYTVADWDRAIRHGVGRDGRPLLFMPSEAYQHLTDEEVVDVIAWLQALPPVDRPQPETDLGPVTRLLLAMGQPVVAAEIVDHDRVGGERPAPAGLTGTEAAGHHLARIGGCFDCHGPDLVGGRVPGSDPSWPPASNLTPAADGLGRYKADSFRRVMREGRKVDDTQIDPKIMPWPSYAAMMDDEIAALWSYLRSLEARPADSR